MSQLKQDILTLLKSSGGLKTSEIAQKLQADKSDVKMVLFKDLKDICYQDTSYKWHYQAQDTSQNSNPIDTDEQLSNLCKYYLKHYFS